MKTIDVSSKVVSRYVETRKVGNRGIIGEPRPKADSRAMVSTVLSRCTEAQIYDLAERSVVIAWQSKLRQAKSDAAWNEKTVTLYAEDFLRGESTVDVVGSARKSMEKMTREQLVEFAKALKAKLEE